VAGSVAHGARTVVVLGRRPSTALPRLPAHLPRPTPRSTEPSAPTRSPAGDGGPQPGRGAGQTRREADLLRPDLGRGMQPIGQLERALPPASRRAASVSAQAVSCSGVTVGAGVGGLAVDQALRHPWPVFGSFRTFGAAQDRRHDIALKDQASFGFAPRSRHGSASGEAVALKFSCISIG
jgi:hypothetical protein